MGISNHHQCESAFCYQINYQPPNDPKKIDLRNRGVYDKTQSFVFVTAPFPLIFAYTCFNARLTGLANNLSLTRDLPMLTPSDPDQQNTFEDEEKNEVLQEAMLTPLEARILGSLMEKQLTTPDTYPLSLNSLQLACNQKTSREPVMNLQEGIIHQCLNGLQDRKLVEVDYGSRANKFNQRLSRTLHFDKPEQAIFCIMLLRGPQTIHELFSRTKRMYEFESSNEIEHLIATLLGKYTPLIVKLPAQSGQREARYMHLLCGKPEAGSINQKVSSTNEQSKDDLSSRVEALEKQVAWLIEKLTP